MMQAARTSSAAIIKAGGIIDGTQEKAIDFVERFSGLNFDLQGLTADVADPLLPVRLYGDIVLVSENLRDDAVASLLAGMTALAHTCEVPAAGTLVVDDCASVFADYRKHRRR